VSKKHRKPEITVHAVTDALPNGMWLHTHGMWALDLPELEVRDIPLFLAPFAQCILTEACDYIIEHPKGVKPGHTLTIGDTITVQFRHAEPIPDQPDHYKHEVWALVDPDDILCARCKNDNGGQVK